MIEQKNRTGMRDLYTAQRIHSLTNESLVTEPVMTAFESRWTASNKVSNKWLGSCRTSERVMVEG